MAGLSVRLLLRSTDTHSDKRKRQTYEGDATDQQAPAPMPQGFAMRRESVSGRSGKAASGYAGPTGEQYDMDNAHSVTPAAGKN